MMTAFKAQFNSKSTFGASLDNNDTFNSKFRNVQNVVTNVHNELQGRDALDAHPISSITGLTTKLDDLDIDAISTEEIIRMFN